MNERQTYSVIFSVLTPNEGQMFVDATSEDHAKDIANQLLEGRYKDVRIVDVHEIDPDTQSKIQATHPKLN